MKKETYRNPENGKTMTRKEYFDFMFGEEFMKSEDKGRLKQYEIKNQK